MVAREQPQEEHLPRSKLDLEQIKNSDDTDVSQNSMYINKVIIIYYNMIFHIDDNSKMKDDDMLT